MEEQIIMKEVNKKKRIITNNDENNINYYKELNAREPRKYNQSIDYYDLLKQQIKYYKELNASLKEDIETVKKCKKIKQLEELNEINKLTFINKEKDDANLFLSNNNSETKEKMRQELNGNELKISDLQTKKKKIEKKELKFKNVLDRGNDNFPNCQERNDNYAEGGIDLQISSNFGDSKNTQTKQTNINLGNSCSDEQCVIMRKELKRLEKENQFLRNNIIQLNETIKSIKINKTIKKDININNNNDIEYQINDNREDFINNNMDEFKDKLSLDNKRLRIYIEKIEELQNILNQYRIQINSLTEEIKQKDEKMKILIYKLNIKNGNNKEDNEINTYFEELNITKKECEKLKNENEKLYKEKEEILKNNKNIDSEIKNKELNKNKKELENKIKELINQNEENENKLRNIELKNKKANDEISLLNQQILDLNNQLNDLNNKNLENNINDVNNLELKYNEAENIIKNLQSKIKESENEISLLTKDKN